MKKIIALILLTFSINAQTLVKIKQVGDGLGTGSMVVTGASNGALTYSSIATVLAPYATTAALTSSYVTYTGATGSLNLGANNFSVGAQSTLNTLYVPSTATVNGAFLSNSTASVRTSMQIGAAATQTDLLHVNTSAVGTGALIGNARIGVWGSSASYAVFRNQAATDATGYALLQDNAGFTYLNAGTQVQVLVGTNAIATFTDRKINFNPVLSTSGSNINFNFTCPNSTGLTASTNIPYFKVIGGTKQFATGAHPAQYFNYLSGNTITYVGASTTSTLANLAVEPSTGGTNATITHNAAIHVPSVTVANSTNAYGLYVDIPSGASTRNYGWYTKSSSDAYNIIESSLSNGGATIDYKNGNVNWRVGNQISYNTQDFEIHTVSGGTAGTKLRVSNGGATNQPTVQVYGTFSVSSTFSAGGRVETKQGVSVASANNLALGSDGNVFEITGTTQINLISNANWQDGSEITLLFTSTPTVKNGQATSTSNITIKLAGGVDFSATADDALKLVLSTVGGVQAWREVSRSVN